MPDDATIGIVTALTIEHAAVLSVLDDRREQLPSGDRKGYFLGTAPSTDAGTPHLVALTQQTRDGTRYAAATVTDLLSAFPSVRMILMCGIAAGAPSAGVRLGDIVSATRGIVDYGHIEATDRGATLRRAPGDVAAAVVAADNRLAGAEMRGRQPWLATLAALERENAGFRRPPVPGTPLVHRGSLGSSDVLHRNAELRDRLAREHRLLGLEMEASGVADAARDHDRGYFVVRGISDLADRNKDDRWHGYAAAGAAAYLRALLGALAPIGTTTNSTVAGGSLAATGRIVNALLTSRPMRDEHDRQRVIDALPGYIRSGIPYSAAPRPHVVSIVTTCQGFPNGLDALLGALNLMIGGESPEYSALEDVIRNNWNHA